MLLHLIVLFPLFGSAQQALLDSAMMLQYSNPDAAVELATQVIDAKNDKRLTSNAWEVRGIALWVDGQYAKAIIAHQQSLEIREEIDFKKGVAYSLNNLGLNYHRLGDKTSAMERFLSALEMAEVLPDSNLMASVMGNIGILYEEQSDYEKALELHSNCLTIAKNINDQRLVANTLNNIALVYNYQGELEKAASFAKRCLAMRKQMNDALGEAQALNLLGIIASGESDFILADSLFRIALHIYDAAENNWGTAMVLGNLGDVAVDTDEFVEAVGFCEKALALSREHQLEWEASACKCLARAFTGLNDAQKSNEYWTRFTNLQDSLHQSDMENDISILEQRYNHEKEQALSAAEIKRQRQLRNASVGIGMMALLLFFMAFNNYKNKQRDNELLEQKNQEISEQKEVIEEKNLHITDSIRYAQSLQQAILPKDAAFEGRFEKSFIFYRPKDIVSGDFYWLEDVNDTTFIAVADCTGHGVPGAMVSMVGYQGLNKAVREKQLSKPSEILQSLSDHVEEQFEKSGGSVKDGMDIALIALSKDQKSLTFAGAHNPLLLVSKRAEVEGTTQKESSGEYNMFEVKSDRRSIGGYFDAGPFTDHVLSIEKGDTLFMFSDGYGDQFGGEKGKKLGIKRLRQTLLNAVAEQSITSLESFFDEWKQTEEQIDDVALMALTV